MNASDDRSLSDTKVFTICSTAVNLVLSLPTNGYVAWLIWTGAGRTLEAELLLHSLAAFEILFCCLSTFRFLNMMFSSVDFLSPLASALLWSGRPVLQCCVCVEQFLAVVHPVLFLRFKPLRYKAAASGLAWAAIVGFSVFYTLSPDVKHLVFVGECVVLVSVMLFYFSVLVALRRPGPGDGNRNGDSSIKRRAVLTLFQSHLPLLVRLILSSLVGGSC